MLLPVLSDDRMLVSFTTLKRKISQNKTFPLLHCKLLYEQYSRKQGSPFYKPHLSAPQHLTMLHNCKSFCTLANASAEFCRLASEPASKHFNTSLARVHLLHSTVNPAIDSSLNNFWKFVFLQGLQSTKISFQYKYIN